jgi:hypothetical protein
MTKKHPTVQTDPLCSSRVEDLLHAIALAMARRQMEKAWPSTSNDQTAIG